MPRKASHGVDSDVANSASHKYTFAANFLTIMNGSVVVAKLRTALYPLELLDEIRDMKTESVMKRERERERERDGEQGEEREGD